MKLSKEYSRRLRRLAQEMCISLEMLSINMGFSNSTLSRWTNGGAISEKSIDKIKDFLGEKQNDPYPDPCKFPPKTPMHVRDFHHLTKLQKSGVRYDQ